MPGLDLSQVSCNWKKLQDSFQTGKKPSQQQESTTSNGLKRKRVDGTQKTPAANVQKRPRSYAVPKIAPSRRERTMGVFQSTTSNPNPDDASKTSAQSASDGTPASQRKAGRYVALDCEMVGTGPFPHVDHVLGRASMVNYHGETVYDTYAQAAPGMTVHDYRTAITGITPSHMMESTGAKPFTQVRNEVAGLLKGRILVGHALKHDFAVLQLTHRKSDVRDTSRHPPFRVASKGKPPALRNLTRQELGWEIQLGAHSSVEDARAAMMLFRKEKEAFERENRKHFGVPRTGKPGKLKQENVEDSEDEEGDWTVLDGEEKELSEEVSSQRGGLTPAPPAKKKRKSKKRTKRK